MNHHLAFDIETAPILESVAEEYGIYEKFYDKPFDGSQWKLQKTINRKREEYYSCEETKARKAKHDEKEEERYNKVLRKATLDATMCRVLCISYWNESSGGWVEWCREDELLQSLWHHCLRTQQHGGMIFSASGTHFDLKMSYRRSLANGIVMNPNLRTLESYKGGQARPHRSFVDLSQIWACGDYQLRVKVDSLARVFGVAGKHTEEGVTGASFWKVAADDRDRAERYALQDAKIVWDIAARMRDSNVWIESVNEDS